MIPPLLLVTGMLAVVIGVPVGLYVVFTSDQRRTTRAVRAAAAAQGWRYTRPRLQGNPAAFRIEGTGANSTSWVLLSGNTSTGADRGWGVQLTLRFPALGGEPDFAIEPREVPRLQVPAGIAGGWAAFEREGTEAPSGLPAFDAVYRVIVLTRNINQPPVSPALAQRILEWPADAIRPHSVIAGRHSYGFEIEARLPDSPNPVTVSWLVSLGEDLIARLPSPMKSTAPPAFADRFLARFRS